MKRDVANQRLGQAHLSLEEFVTRGRQVLRATATPTWWWAAAIGLVGGGAAAGLHAPTAGAWFWHLANGELIHARGLGGSATFLAPGGAALDMRSWAADLGLYFIYSRSGLAGLQVLGAVGGAATGAVLFLAARQRGRSHPLVLVLVGGLGLLALASVLTDLSAELLALLAGALLLALATTREHPRRGGAALVLLIVLWANIQSDAMVAVLVIWGWLILAHWEGRGSDRLAAPSWWFLPLTAAAVLLSPRGLGAVTELPLSLGMSGEHPLLLAWSSIDFHPWSARISELMGLVLLFSYWLAARRLRRADAFLGLITAAMALLWTNYLPWFLVVAAVQSCWCLSQVCSSQARVPAAKAAVGGDSPASLRGGGAAAAIPVLIVAALLGGSALGVARDGGAEGQARVQLPVQAAGWLSDHPVPGAWFTTDLFGDYLSTRFPDGHHVLCEDDPLPLAGAGLQACQALTVLNSGALAILSSNQVRLAVLPRAAPQVSFLLAERWRIRYRDSTTVVLAPRNP
ncbi:MAG: hypothetical protein WBA31_08510 [Candidatus Dormiibacterota bacterium]